ncbi:MAG: FAD-dependent oxidoreductase [Chloroflexi bacterium]|nr:FAD-dependent oxidoreductase [Chloroflexota bacterium]MCC6895079.1 FAD-dependent oxidoreductase [Anaerolineae bacterium]
MRDVVIIGGGLSGLSAARELQRLNIPYRLIEVKKRLGGSIVSESTDGFVLDGGAFSFHRDDDWSFLPELGLQNALVPVVDSHQRDLVAFSGGTEMLVNALAKDLNGTFIHRMAISSLGTLDGKFTLCLENGLMWDAAALIVAAPARHAERMFRTLAPELSFRLFNYGYDTITRVSVGYKKDDMPVPPIFPWDVAIPFYSWTDSPQRVPPGHVLLNLGVRMLPKAVKAEAIISEIHRQIKAQGKPVISRVDYWEDADPLPPHLPDFTEKTAALEGLLPPGVALAGSDYHGLSLAARVAAGQRAAQSIGAYLKS